MWHVVPACAARGIHKIAFMGSLQKAINYTPHTTEQSVYSQVILLLAVPPNMFIVVLVHLLLQVVGAKALGDKAGSAVAAARIQTVVCRAEAPHGSWRRQPRRIGTL